MPPEIAKKLKEASGRPVHLNHQECMLLLKTFKEKSK